MTSEAPLIQHPTPTKEGHTCRSTCRSCGSTRLKRFLDLGVVPLANSFFPSTTTSFESERVYPLRIVFCEECTLIFVQDVIDMNIIFKHYVYFSSQIKKCNEYFREFAYETPSLLPPESSFIVEIASNDGVFLLPLIEQGYKALGVDPAENIVQPLIDRGVPCICDYWNEGVAEQIVAAHGNADGIFASNCMAHIDDMDQVLKGVCKLLKKSENSIFVVQVHYLKPMIEEVQYDWIYHEHMSYWSLHSFEYFVSQYGLVVFDVRPIAMYGGSMRYYMQFRDFGTRPVTEAVGVLREQEKVARLNLFETYLSYADRVNETRTELLALLDSLKAEGKTIVGYGASGRMVTLATYCGLNRYINAIIDDAPSKQGTLTPGHHIPVVSSQLLHGPTPPDYVLLFAWSFAEGILKANSEAVKKGVRFIAPLPTVRVLGDEGSI